MSDSKSKPRAAAVEHGEQLTQLFDAIVPLLKEYERANEFPDDSKVIEYHAPSKLKELFAASIGNENHSIQQVIGVIERMFQYSLKTTHPRFLNQLFAGSDPVGQVAELVTAVLNTNVYTYTVAPLFSMMEIEVLSKISEQAGFDPAVCEGILVPGGTYANMVGMIVARHHHFPHVRTEGWKEADKPVGFTSAQAHYSVRRAAMILGMGMNQIRGVECDIHGSIVPEALEKAIATAKEEGLTPFFVSSTAGTTVMGGFDNFPALSKIAKANNMWFHIDGAWGGAAIFSDKIGHLVEGVELADSFAWDAHKGLGVPILCAGIVVNNHKGLLRASNNSSAEYLFHPTETNEYDLGDLSLQCGRRAESIKVWLSWYFHGASGFGKRVELAYDNAQYLADILEKDERFALVARPQYCNVCFWYLPKCLRSYRDKLDTIYPQLDEATQKSFVEMQKSGKILFNFNPLKDKGLPRFFRPVLNAPWVTREDMDFLVEELDRVACDLQIECP